MSTISRMICWWYSLSRKDLSALLNVVEWFITLSRSNNRKRKKRHYLIDLSSSRVHGNNRQQHNCIFVRGKVSRIFLLFVRLLVRSARKKKEREAVKMQNEPDFALAGHSGTGVRRSFGVHTGHKPNIYFRLSGACRTARPARIRPNGFHSAEWNFAERTPICSG